MKILIAHNDYGKYSGEEAVVDRMAHMLEELGHKVVQLRKTTANSRESLVGKIHGFFSGIYCPSGIKAMRQIIRDEKPDIVNVHNLFPFISPAALRECKKAGIPVVMTVHNFRLMCPTGLFMRDNMPCELCREAGNEWNCIRYNCEGSLTKSLGYAARNAVARLRRDYLDCIEIFACITDYQRKKLIASGFPENKVIVIPNTITLPTEKQLNNSPGEYVAYSGRISREKGVDMIIQIAHNNPDIPFKIAGAARDEDLIEQLPRNIELMGYLSGDSLKQFYQKARFFVMASRWYEGFPMTILEAGSYSKPMIAPDHGGFTEIIGSQENAIGRLFEPFNKKALEQEIRSLWYNPEECTRLGQLAYNKILNEYSTDVIARKWADLFYNIKKNYC